MVKEDLNTKVDEYNKNIRKLTKYEVLQTLQEANNKGELADKDLWKSTLIICDGLIFQDRTDALAYKTRGDAQFKLGHLESALRDFDIVIRLNSNDAFAYLDRGAAKGILGDHKAAPHDYNKTI